MEYSKNLIATFDITNGERTKTLKCFAHFGESGAFQYGNRSEAKLTFNDGEHTSETILDLRYDKSFHRGKEAEYLIDYIGSNWSGENGSWKAVHLLIEHRVEDM